MAAPAKDAACGIFRQFRTKLIDVAASELSACSKTRLVDDLVSNQQKVARDGKA
jgi:hypothetical protein